MKITIIERKSFGDESPTIKTFDKGIKKVKLHDKLSSAEIKKLIEDKQNER